MLVLVGFYRYEDYMDRISSYLFYLSSFTNLWSCLITSAPSAPIFLQVLCFAWMLMTLNQMTETVVLCYHLLLICTFLSFNLMHIYCLVSGGLELLCDSVKIHNVKVDPLDGEDKVSIFLLSKVATNQVQFSSLNIWFNISLILFHILHS